MVLNALVKERGSWRCRLEQTKLKERQTVGAAAADLLHWVTMLNLRLLNLTAGPDSGTEVRPSAWRHGALLTIRRDSLPFLLSSALSHFSHLIQVCLVQCVLPVLLYIWLIDGLPQVTVYYFHRLSGHEHNSLNANLHLPLPSSSWLGHQPHFCI